ncbi:MAG: FecR family protein [Planctomycetota bacterium]|nr:FecR family protein [Planctomycetota bacterium]
MSRRVTHADLVARALGALPAEAKAQVDQAIEADAALRRQFEEVAGHLLAYDRLPPAPPPPPFARLDAALDADFAQAPDLSVLRLPRRAAPRWLNPWVAAALLLAGLLIWNATDSPRDDQQGDLLLLPGRGLQLVRGEQARPAPALAAVAVLAGDVLTCDEPAEAQLGERVRLVLDAGARLRIENAERVTLEAGRAWFEVRPGAFEVGTAHGPVRVLGTAFEVDLRTGALDVAVAHGRVAAGGHELSAGQRLVASSSIEPDEGRAGAWFQRPSLIVAGGPARLGEPLRLVLRLENRTSTLLTLPAPSDARFAFWLHFADAEGQPIREIPILPAQIVAGREFLRAGGEAELRPGATREVTVEIPAPFTSAGTYLCRALYRPAGRPGVLSDARPIEVRE